MNELRPQALHPRFLPSFLRDTSQSKLAYILKAWLLTLLPSLALAFAVSALFGQEKGPEFGQPGLVLFLLLVAFAPIVETLIMVLPLLLLNRLFGPQPAIIVSSLGWAVAHSSQVPVWGLIVWWPFLIFSTILLVWRERGLAKGMLIVMAVHALQNAVPALLLLADNPS
ncbi:MAG: hypothetical protein H0W74_03265 [Sphingosinicella sp.]|nr:hypothetical protein [Sphingosinicella sp.]